MSSEKSAAVNGDSVGTRVIPSTDGGTAVQPASGAPHPAAEQGPVAAREPGPSGSPATETGSETASQGPTEPDAGRRAPRRGFRRRSTPPREDQAPAAPPREGTGTAAAPRTAPPAPRPSMGPRRVRLAVSRIDPWSIMKLAFLLSIAIGIALVIATAVVWNVLNTMQVFTQADGIVTDIAGTESFIDILDYVQFSRVISIAVVIAVVDVVLLTALATLFAFLYNVTAALVGGLHVTLTDE